MPLLKRLDGTTAAGLLLQLVPGLRLLLLRW
jgi:hypothetical protein